MANRFLTPKIVAREALMILQSNTVMAGLVYRDYEGEFNSTAKVGDTISIRKPAVFEAREFSGAVDVQDVNEGGIALTLDKHLDVTASVTSKEWTLELDDFSARIIRPAMVALNEKVDAHLCGLYPQFSQVAGTAGTQPTSLQALAALDRAMNEARIPVANRNVVVMGQCELAGLIHGGANLLVPLERGGAYLSESHSFSEGHIYLIGGDSKSDSWSFGETRLPCRPRRVPGRASGLVSPMATGFL